MFRAEKTKNAGKYTRGVGKDRKKIYSKKVWIEGNATWTDIEGYVDKEMERIAKQYPDAQMNVAIKYAPISDPKSGGWFSVLGNKRLTMPYDWSDYGLEYLYIQYTLN